MQRLPHTRRQGSLLLLLLRPLVLLLLENVWLLLLLLLVVERGEGLELGSCQVEQGLLIVIKNDVVLPGRKK